MEKSQTDTLDRKGWREHLKKIIRIVIKNAYSYIKWIFHYSGLKYIYRKFNPPKNPQPLPTGCIWAAGIYVALFGVASQRYENRIDIIENRTNSIYTQLAVPSVQKKALSRISRVQNMSCPYKPNILNPPSVFISLFRDSKYGEMIEQLKETVEDWKGTLDSVDLTKAILKGADLQGANLQGALLGGADLKGAGLWKADLGGADLVGADLEGADLKRANLQEANLWEANFKGANFWMANLQGANLQEANLQEASLTVADLRKANLRGATGSTVEQLCKALTLYKAKLDQELEAQIKQKCPDLLKEPQRNNPDEKK